MEERYVVVRCKYCDELIAVPKAEAISWRTILRRHHCPVITQAERYWW
jgi:hypothetical protein